MATALIDVDLDVDADDVVEVQSTAKLCAEDLILKLEFVLPMDFSHQGRLNRSLRVGAAQRRGELLLTLLRLRELNRFLDLRRRLRVVR